MKCYIFVYTYTGMVVWYWCCFSDLDVYRNCFEEWMQEGFIYFFIK